jgi:filamentous hemagglutinin family protein
MNHIYRSIWSDALGTWIAVSEQCKSKGKGKRSSTILLMTSLLLASPSGWSLPTGDQLVAGQATVSSPNVNTLQINQASQNAIINWQGFSVEQNQAVNIQQPNTQAALLNRVVGQDASQIQGQINANGQVYLVNPNGVLFSKTAQVDVGGLVASTHNINNADFMSGNHHFTQNGATGTVQNDGTINAQSGGVVALISSSVTNTGNINTPNGTTALAAGKTVDLDFQGNGLVEVKVSEAALNAQIANKGAIQADGGRIIMSAQAAGQLIDTVINQQGIVRAQGLVERNGEIILDGGSNGATQVSGTVDVSSKTTGGKVSITGADVHIQNNALVTASGNAGGGNIVIGDKKSTSQTIIEDGAKLSAQVTEHGNAGKIDVFANMDTGTVKVAGHLDASAPNSGNGGFIDTSAAHVEVADTAIVSTKATNGTSGNWLIDPADFTIAPTATGTVTGGTPSGDISGATLSNALGSGSVTIHSDQGSAAAGNGDIFVNDVVSYNSPNSLTLNALRHINVNSTINNTGTGSVNLRADFSGACITGATNCGTVNFLSGGQITANTVNIYYNPDSIGVPNTIYSSVVTGTLNAYMLINDIDQLQAINNNFGSYLGGTYALGKDIKIEATWNGGASFVPIDSRDIGFYGVFDGLNHVITGLTINLPTAVSPVGLFGRVASTGIVRNLGLEGVSVTGSDYVGGLAGFSSGKISNVYATGRGVVGSPDVSGRDYVGGLVGFIDNFNGASSIGGAASVDNVYATGSVNGISNVGGLVGINTNMAINNAYAAGRVIGASNVGGLAGSNGGAIGNSFWNTETTGQLIGIGSGNIPSVTGKTNTEMQTLSTFTSAGWNIDDAGGTGKIWRIYGNNSAPLLRSFLTPLTVNASKTYDGLINGGTAVYTNTLTGVVVTPNANSLGTLTGTGKDAGPNALTGLYSLQIGTLSKGVNNVSGYDISLGSLTIGKADLTLSGSRVYNGLTAIDTTATGTTLNATGVNNEAFAISGTTTVGSPNVQYSGSTVISQALTGVSGLTLGASNGTNPALASNYNLISATGSQFTINKAALAVTGANNNVTYNGNTQTNSGATYTAQGTDSFTVSGYGSATNASTTAYADNLTLVENGNGLLSNYAITYTNGALTVNPAVLSITANNASKTYGQLLNFAGTEFISSGLQNGETIGSVSLASAGAVATAPVVGNPYAITASNAAGGTFNASNYAITFNNGLLSVNPAALSITANNASKIFGQTLNFTGTEFISSGLQNGETIGSVTLASLGAVAAAPVAGSPYTITASNATDGTFSPSNYTITYNDGILRVTPNATLNDNIAGLVGRNFNTINWLDNSNAEIREPEADLVRIDDNSDNFTGYPSNNSFLLIDLAQDDKKRIVPKLKFKNSAGKVKVLHVSDDGQFLSLLLEDGTVRVWDLQRGVQRNIVDPKQTQALTDIGAVNDKGELLSIAGTTGIGTFDIVGAINEDKLSIKGRNVNHFANSSDGNLLLVNLGTNNMRLWDNAQRKELWQLQSNRGEVKDLVMSNDKLRAAVLTRQEGVYAYDAKLGKLKQITDAIDIIDIKTGKITTSLPNVLDQVVYLRFIDHDTLQVALKNGELQNWSLNTNSKKSASTLVEKLKTVDNVGETYAYTTDTGVARVGDAQGNVQLSIQNKDNLITDARLLEKGKKLLTVFETGDLALWDITSGKKMLRLFSSKQGGWTVMDAFGRFDGSEDAMENFDWIAENDTIPLDNFSENYYEPGLLATILQERDYFNSDSNRIIDGISLPPKVDLQLAAQQAGNDKVAVQLNVFDRGGGINKVNIYHNGKLINHDDLVVVPTNGDAEQRTLTLQLSPNAGKNTLKVVASNELGIENGGTEISFDGKTKAYDSAMRLMSVGINKYSDHDLNLSYSVADAQLIEETLKNSGKLLASKVLIDQQATKPHILAELKEISQGAQQDVLIIYLAGHGVALGKEWYFLPHETKMQTNIEQMVNTGITATELSDIFKDSKIQHIFLMVDSCYSGAGMDAFNKLENGQRYLSRRLGRSLGITVVTAAAKNEEAAEVKSLGHGVFTYLMSEEMQKKQTNEPITAHGIAQRMADTLPMVSKQMTGTSQDPAIYMKGNNFILSDVAKDKK